MTSETGCEMSDGGSAYTPQAFREQGGFRHADSVIFPPCVLVGLGQFRIEQKVQIDAFCYILGGTGVVLGARTHLASGVTVSGGGALETGWCSVLSAGVKIITGTDDPTASLASSCVPDEYRNVRRLSVAVDDFAVVFTNSVVFPGVRIGKGAVVGAGSVVRSSVEPWGVYAGNPLRKIGDRDRAAVESAAAEMRERYGV